MCLDAASTVQSVDEGDHKEIKPKEFTKNRNSTVQNVPHYHILIPSVSRQWVEKLTSLFSH